MGYGNLEPDLAGYVTRDDVLGAQCTGSPFWLMRGDNGIYLRVVRQRDLEVLETDLWSCSYFERSRDELLEDMQGICEGHGLRPANGIVAAGAYHAIKPGTNFTGWRYWLGAHPDESLSVSLQNGAPQVHEFRAHPRAFELLEYRRPSGTELEGIVHESLQTIGMVHQVPE